MSAREEIEGWFSPGIRPAVSRTLGAFEAEIRKGIAANIRAAASKYLDNDMDVHVWHVLDDLSNEVENTDKDNA